MDTLFSSRPILLFIIILSMSGYNVLNNLIKKGRRFKHRLDDHVPFWPIFVYPYLFGYVAWFVWLIGSAFFQPILFMQQLTASIVIACNIGYSFFIFFPTYVDSPLPHGYKKRHEVLRKLHAFDRPFNSFPSMHVYLTTVLTIYSSILYPLLIPLFLIFGATISVSTVLIKRHYLYDIPGGLVVGVLSSALALYLI